MHQASLPVSVVNGYLAHKQHLLPRARIDDLIQVTRDIVALHATNPTAPYLSLFARIPDFQQARLDSALEEGRELVRHLCMRMTLHALPSDELPHFFQAFAERRMPTELQGQQALLVSAGLCGEQEAPEAILGLHSKIVEVLRVRGKATVRELGQAVPELRIKIQHSKGKPYAGTFGLGSRLVPGMCTLGHLVRTRTRGTWRSSQHEYAALIDWLPAIDLEATSPREARRWLVSRYLSAFGPATVEDIQWWTGFSKGETQRAVQDLEPSWGTVGIDGFGDEYLMLSGDLERLLAWAAPQRAYAFCLPGLDPYIMGYRDRRRFLRPQHREKVFDRSGNAMPTVWVSGRVVGVWGQCKDGNMAHGLFEAVDGEERCLLEAELNRLDGFLDGELLAQRSHTAFTQELCK